jgi:hypothetical protein
VLTAIGASGGYYAGSIAGACARVFDISGSTFEDANNNSVKDVAETGVGGATVYLLSASDSILCSTLTDPLGNFLFDEIPEGTYRVKLDTSTLAQTSTTYLKLTTGTAFNVVTGPNSTGNNFGFSPKSDKLINDLRLKILPTNGFTPGFWKKQLQLAISGSRGIVGKDSLLTYIGRIRLLLLQEPYQLRSPDGGLTAAYAILNRSTKTPMDVLNKQLLALELNHVSRHGITGTDATLQLGLIAWGEALAAGSPSASSASASIMSVVCPTCAAVDVYNRINKSSGGGTSF